MQKSWGFYGRSSEIDMIEKILDRGRWFFCAISGRRRIGKTTLIKEAFQAAGHAKYFYVQIPDSDERGVVQAFQDAAEAFGVPTERAQTIRTFPQMAATIGDMCRRGWVIILDEFQYFHRKSLAPFQSLLQAEVDVLRDTEAGGLFVLGSIHTEMTAILEDRNAPLFNRITDRIAIEHWDFTTLFEMLDAHDITDPRHQLFLWSLFEGVPKFYRDCFDHGVLAPSPDHRRTTMRRLFFEGSSPLRDEADNWFLREFRGRYDTVLKLLARLGPCSHGTLTEEFRRAGTDSEKQLGGYLSVLVEKYRMVERQLPVFARAKDRKARYAITDNFLAAWLGALARNIAMARVRPIDGPLAAADTALAGIEGFTFEKMIRLLTEEASKSGAGDFALTDFVRGYWNKADGSDIEIDLVACNEVDKIVRFGSCKRDPSAHDADALAAFNGHVERFLATKEGRRFADWTMERTLYSPQFDDYQRQVLTAKGYLCRDIPDFRAILFDKKA